MRYRLLGLDLDGTLLDKRGQVSPENLRAVAAAQDAGVLVVPCTGRAWREAKAALAPLPRLEVGVFVGGAAVSEIATGRTLELAVLEPHLVRELVRFLHDAPEAVLVFRDAALAGHDYLVTGRGTLDANTEWWFQSTGATVRFQREVTPEDLHHALRVGIVATGPRMREATARLAASFAGRITMQSFQAVNMPDPEQAIYVLEVFGRGVDKWRGLAWLAARRGIAPAEVAAIGDESNDLAMLRAAGCGIAMGNAIPSVKECAKYVTHTCEDCGVAHAIDRLLSGVWD